MRYSKLCIPIRIVVGLNVLVGSHTVRHIFSCSTLFEYLGWQNLARARRLQIHCIPYEVSKSYPSSNANVLNLRL